MKINKLDAHDRYSFYQKQEFDIGKQCQEIVNSRPFDNHPFYIYAHTRTVGLDEKISMFASGNYASFDLIPEKRIIWQPRLTKPKATPNSMLFKAYPGSDNIKIVWILPPEELWEQFKKGNMTENESVSISIYDYEHNRDQLEAKEEDDLPDEAINRIYTDIKRSTSPRKYGSI